jgi:hypothetical protein
MGRVGTKLVENGADGVDDIDVVALAAASDVIGLAAPAVVQHAAEGRAMVLDVEPVANVLAVAVHRKSLALQCVVDHQRDQLLGKLEWAVVVGAVGGQRRQVVGVKVGADEVIGSSLGGGIRAVGRVRCGLAKCWIVVA